MTLEISNWKYFWHAYIKYLYRPQHVMWIVFHTEEDIKLELLIALRLTGKTGEKL